MNYGEINCVDMGAIRMTFLDEQERIMKMHSKMYIGNLLIKMYYPNVITFLVKQVGAEEARKRLYQVGQQVGRELLRIRKPKTTDIKKMISGFFKFMWNTTKNIKIKKIKEKDRLIYRITDNKCGICDPETAIEGVDVPCVSVDGYLDACLEYISKTTPIPAYKIQTLKSVATGDEYCEHQIEIGL